MLLTLFFLLPFVFSPCKTATISSQSLSLDRLFVCGMFFQAIFQPNREAGNKMPEPRHIRHHSRFLLCTIKNCGEVRPGKQATAAADEVA